VRWLSAPATASPDDVAVAVGARPVLTENSSVLALVPHYRCEEWLFDCLESLVAQARSPEGIVVIDDGSALPPVEIVRQFPQVTLLAAVENVGLFRLMQQVISDTSYDAYLLQDADDWSAQDRLAIFLAEAERTGAELIGCQELRLSCDEGDEFPICYPLDVNAALAEQPTAYPLLFGSAVVSRDLVLRLGGFATGLRFGGDGEFVRRAAHVARIVNVPRYCYFRRKRAGSLTSAPDTGLQSPARAKLREALLERAMQNATAVARGESPVLEPYARAGPVQLTHILGPRLRPAPKIRG
jgi:glycosyltransferase involved in cell wall biosynthesis